MVTPNQKPRGRSTRAKTPGESPLARAVPEEIRREATVLRDLLAATLPPFARSRQELRLEPGASPLLAAFWETMGWSELFDAALAHPDREQGAARARKTLSDFVSQGDTELRVRDLPRELRLVEVDSGGVGFMFTDETDSPSDPPVLGIASESSKIHRVSSSYLRHVAGTLSGLVFRRWYDLSFELAPGERLPGEPALRLLCPNLRRIGDELWIPGGEKKKTREGVTFPIAFRTSAALLGWLAEHPHLPVGILSVELLTAKLPASRKPELLREIGAKAVQSARGWHAVGSLLGQPVLARSSGGELALFVGRRERHALLARLTAEPKPSEFSSELAGKFRYSEEPDVERAPALTLTLEEHRQQAREFADWVEEIAPEHRAEKTALELEPQAPGAVAALWGALGASKTVMRRQFWPPTRAASDAAATAALARWFEDSETRDRWNLPADPSCAPEAWLPHPLRMVERYVPTLKYDYLVPRSSFLDFADESSRALDPPVVRVSPGRRRPVLLSRSYVRYLSSRIADEFTDFGSALAASEALGSKGTRLCAGWFEGLYRLEAGIWFWCHRIGHLVSADDADEDAQRAPLVLFRERRRYFEFCEQLSDEEFAELGPPYEKAAFTLKKAQRFDPADFDAPGFRLVERKPFPRHPQPPNSKEWGISGRIAGAPIYLAVRRFGKSPDYWLHCADSDTARVGAWLEAQKIGFSRPKP
jgi:hypothetical protein